MKMKIIDRINCLCTCCMETHEVKKVLVPEHTSFKNIDVEYEAVYYYCDTAEELYMDEQQIQNNDKAMKNAFRKKQGLLTSDEISDIRKKYGISQRDFCILLGWGGKTITRYESHQVQDKAHDTILKKIEQDSEWYLTLLEDSRSSLPTEIYRKYYEAATALYEKDQDTYLRKAIEAKYVKYHDAPALQGNTALSLDKVIDVIRYFAASAQVTNLYKVKLMKLMWYADALSYKERGHAITGLVYQALSMGAVPLGHDALISMKGVPCEEIDMGETLAYHFQLSGRHDYPFLTEEDKQMLDKVIKKLGKMKKDEIVAFMHKEKAYTETSPKDIIPYKFAKDLQL